MSFADYGYTWRYADDPPALFDDTAKAAALAFLGTRIAHGNSCGVCYEDGWIGACGWNDPDPLRPIETDEEPWPAMIDREFPASPARRYVFLVAAALVAVLLLRKVR